MIDTNLSTRLLSGQASSDRNTVVHPDCVGIVLKQNNFASMAQPLHEVSLGLPTCLEFCFLKIGGTQANKPSNKKAPRPSSGKEYTEG